MIARLFALALMTLGLVACGREDLSQPPEPLGTFQLGFAVVVAPDPQLGPFSREATEDQWVAAIGWAIEERFGQGRFQGGRFTHIAVSVDGYVLAAPGVPTVYTPRSVLIFSVTFWDDATGTKLNEEPIQLTVFEACCNVPFLGSGLSKSKEEQLEALAFNAARAIERTMRENGQWFGIAPEDQEDDPTIVEGDVLADNPELIAPAEAPPATDGS